ncbi:L,D-transpeptidase family protein, partial [Demequina sp.]|uniref:L,D-transpeptidase family protein n=1 Tax=Demequina sp. TaxID=2050685 RepID=UPI0025D4AB45
MRRIVALWSVVGALALAVAGCSPASAPAPDASPAATPGGGSSGAPAITSSPEVPDPYLSYVAEVQGGEITVLDAPGGTDELTVKAADVLTVPDQTPFVFLVKQVQGPWVELYLPVRPNGTTGWVDVDQVVLRSTTMHVEISLEDFQLAVYDGETELLSTEIGLGQDELPTPGGTYFIRELLQPPEPDTVYGPYAYGLSGYSPVLDSFAGGDAVIGIHGTNDPTSIGRAVSHGCIRLPNDAITALVEDIGLPLGTPVHIAAA